MNNRTVLEILPQSVTDFFNEWQLRIIALLSLSSQIALLLLGNRRKYKAEKWLRSILWLGYSPEDLIVTVFVGILSDCQGNGKNPSQQLQAFWMPFLLLHLGGPDTITAYSLEDNELWTRQFLQRLLQFGWAASKIFLKSWKGKLLNIVAVPMFGAGLIKSGEKTWFLKSGSNDQLRKSAIRDRDVGPPSDPTESDVSTDSDGGSTPYVDNTCRCPGHIYTAIVLEPEGNRPSFPDIVFECDRPNRPSYPDTVLEWKRPNYAALTRGYDFTGAPGCHCSCPPGSKECEIVNIPSPKSEKSEKVIIPSPPSRNKTIPDADLLEKADQFFPKFKRLFADVALYWTDLEQSKSFFQNISSAEAFQVVEIELGFMYDVFYAKPVAVYDEFSFLRFINLLVSISALLSFWIIDKHEFQYVDLIITWLLLVEAIIGEIYCIILMCSSERTENWLNKQEQTGMTRIY